MYYKCRSCGMIFDSDEANLYDEETDEELNMEPDSGLYYECCPHCGSDDLIYGYIPTEDEQKELDEQAAANTLFWLFVILVAAMAYVIVKAYEYIQTHDVTVYVICFIAFIIGIFIIVRTLKKYPKNKK